MPLQGLAQQVYQVLRGRVPRIDPRLSYQDVVKELGRLPPPNDELGANDQRLFDALNEIMRACRNHNPPLPVLPAIVVRRNTDASLETPGKGYFPVTHPQAPSALDGLIEWAGEIDRVRKTTYPANI